MNRLFNALLFVLFTSFLFVPFMGSRVLRTAGDDKVYVGTAVEMARDGNWFRQTVADQPDYYKGPGHYLFLRLGILIFGEHNSSAMWATVYMNFLLLLVSGLFLYGVVRCHPPAGLVRRPEESPESWALWVAGVMVSGVGVYLHAFSSQMEVELVACFTIAMALAIRAETSHRAETWFWIVAGLAGWFKSPLHSVFVGLGGVLYWLGRGMVFRMALKPRSWANLLLGIFIGAVGYVPAYLLDKEAFVATYIRREQIYKGPSGEPWWSPVWPILSFYLAPWMLILFASYIDFLGRILRRLFKWGADPLLGPEGKRLLWAGFCFLAPMMGFFIYWDYRMQNYTLPSAAAIAVFMGILWSSAQPAMRRVYQFALGLTGVILWIGAGAVIAMGTRFERLPENFPDTFFTYIALGLAITGALWVSHAVKRVQRPTRPGRILLASIPFYLAFGWGYAVLGEREMVDLKKLVRTHRACELAQTVSKPLAISYFNFPHKLWSEWGYLNFMIGYPVKGLHSTEKAIDAAGSGDVIVVSPLHMEFIPEFKKQVLAKYPDLSIEERPWKRWRTQGKDKDGNPLWRTAWEKKDLSLLETEFLLLQFVKKGERSAFACGT